ncbi:hypothetical protein KEM60_00053 [Austwickia sp. TVS 96-490-7B]|uniref:hypothetical protein n=1 Tax=Austwickia sp. TVS 96-490-7B TaxID=2830843 RepID=UPI001D618B16|nr:hypothetical protein [Austwickia sp. TVS 96-490-7B]MBW3083875.1 hypothetical protein [Austwickia sp. TVS 96-490-7B]
MVLRVDERPARRMHRRPVYLDHAAWEGFGVERLDPAVITEVAHETAAVLVHTGRAAQDPELTDRLVRLVEEIGLDTVAELWSDRPGRSLPGALWRLYLLREWVRRDPAGAGRDFEDGIGHADVAAVIAGVAGSGGSVLPGTPGPPQVRELADEILRGVYDGDLALALERAAAFCVVVAAGRASREEPGPTTVVSAARGPGWTQVDRQAWSAAAIQTMGEDLQRSAASWRRGDLS